MSSSSALPLGAQFLIRDNGQVDVALTPTYAILDEVLNDAVSSVPPRGEPGKGPSTYWIDRALSRIQDARAGRVDSVLVSGNVSVLRIVAGQVEGRFEYWRDNEVGDFATIGDVETVLVAWRVAVIEQRTRATDTFTKAYRRNPYFDLQAKVHCPRCGSRMTEVRGELTCVRGEMGLSFHMREALSDLVTQAPTVVAAPGGKRRFVGGRWHCPADGTRMVEDAGTIVCRACARHLPGEVLWSMIELHPHKTTSHWRWRWMR